MTAAERLAAIRAREQAATPGPWEVAHTPAHEVGLVQYPADVRVRAGGWEEDHDGMTVCLVSTDHEDAEEDVYADAAFIAHARDDVPFLLAELRRRDDALDAVLELHAPIELQEADDTGMPHEPGTGHDWPPICRACSDPDVVSAVEFGDLIGQGEGVPHPCLTVAAITDALGGGR